MDGTRGIRPEIRPAPLAAVLMALAVSGAGAAPRSEQTKTPPVQGGASQPTSGVTRGVPAAAVVRPDQAEATLGGPLVPGQTIQPIDLASALRLGGARDLDIAIAKERVCQAVAELEQARVLLLPSLYLGPNWIRHDGQAQVVQGQVQSISKSSLFLGATAAAGSSVAGPVPAGGPAQVSGLSTILRFSDAIFEPLAARQSVSARRAGVRVATNDALLGVAEAYLDLQQATGTLAIAREAAASADDLTRLTASYARSGAGLDADYRRVLAERDRQRRNVEAAVGQLEVASAELVRRVRLDPRVVVAPVEPPEAVIRMIADACPIDDLITAGLKHRPELAEAQALVDVTLSRLKQARLRPFIPSLAFRYSGGGYGGGVNSFFGDFGGRSDVDVNLYWEVQNLGMADRAIAKSRAAQQRTAVLQMMQLQDRVASEVVRANKLRIATARQLREAALSLPEAINSLSLNLANIRRGAGLPNATRPIEVLQPIQALAQARADYLDAVLAHNRAQFRLVRAIGQCPPSPSGTVPGSAAPNRTADPSPATSR